MMSCPTNTYFGDLQNVQNGTFANPCTIPRNTVNSLSGQQQFTYLDTFTHLAVVALKQIIVSGHHILIQFCISYIPIKIYGSLPYEMIIYDNHPSTIIYQLVVV